MCDYPPPCCDHCVPSVARVSKSIKNPGRAYFTCAKRYGDVNRCDYFRWVDEYVDAVRKGDEEPADAAPPAPRPPAPVSPRMTAEGFLARYVHNVTPEQIEKIKVIDQRSDEWLNARKFRLTASNFGAAAGHCKHNPPMGLVRDMLWHVFQGNEMTRYGDGERAASV